MALLCEVADDEAVLSYLGTGLLYSLRSLARTSADAMLRRQARTLGRRAFALWEQQTLAAADPHNPDWLAEAVRGYGAGTGLGLRRDVMQRYLKRALRPWGSEAMLGFDVERGPLQPGTAAAYRSWCVGLTSAWCGECFDVVLGARYRQVLRWLPRMRDYRLAWSAGAGAGAFHDVAYAVTHVVYTLNEYGHCLLDARWLPDEHLFLRAALPDAMAMDDPDLSGELLDTLRAFGTPDDDPLVRRAYAYLLERQNPDASWGDWGHAGGDGTSFYLGFHATWAVIDGLREYRWHGPTVAVRGVLPMLQTWAARR
jgi:hypothetical protein